MRAINPFIGWDGLRWYKKLWCLIKSPVVFALTITIPVVNEDDPEGTWCQYLHGIQMVLASQFVAFVAGGKLYTNGELIGMSSQLHPHIFLPQQL